jgi:hypothetical protein
MGKHSKKENKKKTFKLGNSKTVNVTSFKGSVYAHIWDNNKHKNVTLSKKEFAKLSKSMADIAHELKKKEKKKVQDSDSDSSGNTDDSDSE